MVVRVKGAGQTTLDYKGTVNKKVKKVNNGSQWRPCPF